MTQLCISPLLFCATSGIKGCCFLGFNLEMLKLNFFLCCFYFFSMSLKNAERREKNENIQLKLHMYVIIIFLCSFSRLWDSRKKRNIWNAKKFRATPQNSHIIKFISNFWPLLFSHFSLGYLSCCFFTLGHSREKANWRQFLKVRMKSLSCNYEDWKNISCCCLSLHSSAPPILYSNTSLDEITVIPRNSLHEWKYFYCFSDTFSLKKSRCLMEVKTVHDYSKMSQFLCFFI